MNKNNVVLNNKSAVEMSDSMNAIKNFRIKYETLRTLPQSDTATKCYCNNKAQFWIEIGSKILKNKIYDE